MLRSAFARASSLERSRAASLAKTFSVSAVTCKAAPPAKRKSKIGGKKETEEKVKKGGLTHLKFSDAVRALRFEKLATDLSGQGLEPLTTGSLQSAKIVTYSPDVQLQLSSLGAFRKFQHHELTRQPVSVVSDNTIAIQSEFVEKLTLPSTQNRICLLGEQGVGKSTLITQAQALALSQYGGDVVLLHIDHAEQIVDGTSDYIYNQSLGKYQQPMFTKRWVRKLRTANEAVLKKIPLAEDVKVASKGREHQLKKGEHTLYDYLLHNQDFGVAGSTGAFQFFIQQLQKQQFPVFVSVDSFNALINKPFTRYFHPDMKPIHVTEFEMGHFLQQLVSGELSFAKGGVLLAETKGDGEAKTLRVGLQLQEPNPYDKPHQCDLEFAHSMTQNGGVTAKQLVNLSKAQAGELLSFWEKTGALVVRNYPAKLVYSEAKDSLQVGEYAECREPEEQLENILNNAFFVSAGNPGRFLKANHMTYV